MAVAVHSIRRSTMRVRALRQWFGLSLDAFAHAVGVGRATVARWEAANRGPRPDSAEGRLLAVIAEIRRLVLEMFRPEEAQVWLGSHIPMLRDTPRATLIKRGPVPVHQVLWEIQHGAY